MEPGDLWKHSEQNNKFTINFLFKEIANMLGERIIESLGVGCGVPDAEWWIKLTHCVVYPRPDLRQHQICAFWILARPAQWPQSSSSVCAPFCLFYPFVCVFIWVNLFWIVHNSLVWGFLHVRLILVSVAKMSNYLFPASLPRSKKPHKYFQLIPVCELDFNLFYFDRIYLICLNGFLLLLIAMTFSYTGWEFFTRWHFVLPNVFIASIRCV